LGELPVTSTTHNTYTNPGSVAQFDFHQSEKSTVSLSCLSFLSSNDLMESVRDWYLVTSVFITKLHTNLRVFIELEYLQPIDVRLRDLVVQKMQRVENTHCLHSLQLSPFLDFDCLFINFLCHNSWSWCSIGIWFQGERTLSHFIILKDMYHMILSLILENRQLTCVCLFHNPSKPH
jgi:hypothetical protein